MTQKRLHVWLDEAQYEWLRKQAYKLNTSVAEVVRAIIKEAKKGK